MNPNFKRSSNTNFLVQDMKKMKTGDVIKYEDLMYLTGSKTMKDLYPSLSSARRILLRDENMVFAPIRGHGLKLLDDSEIIENSTKDVNGIRHKSRKGSRQLLAISDYSKLTESEKLTHTTRMAVFNISEEATSRRGERLISEQAKTKKVELLPVSSVAEAFISSVVKTT